MDLETFAQRLRLCGQSKDEVRDFVDRFARIRLAYIARKLSALRTCVVSESRIPSDSVADWSDQTLLAESGIEPDWIAGTANPERTYLHATTLMNDEWSQVGIYIERAFLSDKQRRLLFPLLSRARRPLAHEGRAVTRADLLSELRRLNSLLRSAAVSGMRLEDFGAYQACVGIHGGSQNLSAKVGLAGAIIATMDAIREIEPTGISDVAGDEAPPGIRLPEEVFQAIDGGDWSPNRGLLLANGRALVFASDPDVAIFQSLGARYTSAAEAMAAWESVRREVTERARRVHVFAVGEVKTATDVQNLHERLALGSRETRNEVRCDRFLMMSALTPDLLDGRRGGRRRQGAGLANRDVERFSDVFNLCFVWGYDGARGMHREHWEHFKERIRQWCFE